MVSKKEKQRKRIKRKQIIVAILIVIIGSGCFYLFSGPIKLTKRARRGIVLELGEPLPTDLSYYVNIEKYKQDEIENMDIDFSEVELLNEKPYPGVGKYQVNIKYKEKIVKVKVVVKDTIAPLIDLKQDKKLYQGGDILKSVVKEVIDLSETTLEVENASELDTMQIGECEVKIKATDAYQNVTKETIIIDIIEDNEKPKFKGLKDKVVYVNGTISYRDGVSVEDNSLINLDFEIDAKAVDLAVPGKYIVIYKAKDPSGNEEVREIEVVVSEATEKIVNYEEVAEYVNKYLPAIIKEGMRDAEKALAIFNWTQDNITKTSLSDKTNWYIGAYEGFTQRKGDCFTYYAVSRAFFDEIGMEYYDLHSNKNPYNHSWLLLNIDGEWYHFDSYPYDYVGNKLFLATDQVVIDFRNERSSGHYWDQSQYPKTADKPYGK